MYLYSRVEFGKQELCHLVVTASNQYLAVWDLLSLTIKWSVPINLSILAADPLSTFMAAFTTDNIRKFYNLKTIFFFG